MILTPPDLSLSLCSSSDGVAVLAEPEAEWAGVWQFTAAVFLSDAVQCGQRGGLSGPGHPLCNHQLQSLQVCASGCAENRWGTSLQVSLLCAQTVCVTQSVTNIVLLRMQSLSGSGDVTVPWSDAEVRRKRPVLYQQYTERTAQTVSGAGSGGLTKGDPLFNLIYTWVIQLADAFSLKLYVIRKYRNYGRW